MSEYESAIFFRIGQEEYAMGVDDVKKIVSYEKPQPIPDAPPYLLGLVRCEGQTLPLVDLQVRFFHRRIEEPETKKFLIIQIANLSLGLLVEEVIGVHPAKREHAQQEERDLCGPARDYLLDFVDRDGTPALLLDASKIFTQMQQREIEALVD